MKICIADCFLFWIFFRSSTIYNPFLYAGLNENFRKEFRLIIPCVFKIVQICRNRKQYTEENEYMDIGGLSSRFSQSVLLKNQTVEQRSNAENTILNDLSNTTPKIMNNSTLETLLRPIPKDDTSKIEKLASQKTPTKLIC